MFPSFIILIGCAYSFSLLIITFFVCTGSSSYFISSTCSPVASPVSVHATVPFSTSCVALLFSCIPFGAVSVACPSTPSLNNAVVMKSSPGFIGSYAICDDSHPNMIKIGSNVTIVGFMLLFMYSMFTLMLCFCISIIFFGSSRYCFMSFLNLLSSSFRLFMMCWSVINL